MGEIRIPSDFRRRKPSLLRILSSRWALKMMNILYAHEKGAKGQFVKIGIGDTGVNLKHRNLPTPDDIFVGAGHEHMFDENGHGSNCWSIIFSGLKLSEFGVGKIANKYGEGSFSQMAAHIRHLADWGCKVASYSLGAPHGSSSKEVDEAIEYAWSKGMIIVAASGNEGTDVGYPANHSKVIAVGAIDRNGVVASFQNSGFKLDFVAPGVDILGAGVDEEDMIASGTSQACPFVVIVLGALIGDYYIKNGFFPSPDEAIRLLRLNSKDIYDKGFDTKTGYGMPYASGTDRAFKYNEDKEEDPKDIAQNIECNKGFFNWIKSIFTA